MQFAPSILAVLLAFCLISCKTGDYRYGNADFTLPTSFSRIHSPGAFTAVARSGSSPEIFMVIRATHSNDPFKYSDAEWHGAGDAALRGLNANRSFSNARELSRSTGYQSGFRTMDHVMAGSVSSFGHVASNVVISSRLFHSRDQVYFFALAESPGARRADPERFSRILSGIRFK
jgi:hypothetical protein